MRTRSSIGPGGDRVEPSVEVRRRPPPPPPPRPGGSQPPTPRSPSHIPPVGEAPLQAAPPLSPTGTRQRQRVPEVEMPPARTEDGWILQVRRSNADGNFTKVTRKIYIHNRMTVLNLAECLQQCLGLNSSVVAGLFCEATHTFYSLQHILSLTNPEQQQRIYCIELPRPVHGETHADRSWIDFIMEQVSFLIKTTTTNGYFLATFLLATLVYYQYELVHETVRFTYSTLYDTMLEEPLRELYRYGPWFVGWEGEDLSTICARITYHGDAQFWLRNTAECARIYNAKEQAFLRISRPFLYVFFFILLFLLVRFLIREYQSYQLQLRNQFQHPQERDMADLYQAFHVILRQVWQVQPLPPSRSKGHVPVDHR